MTEFSSASARATIDLTVYKYRRTYSHSDVHVDIVFQLCTRSILRFGHCNRSHTVLKESRNPKFVFKHFLQGDIFPLFCLAWPRKRKDDASLRINDARMS